MSKKTVSIYAAGGAGVNIAKKLGKVSGSGMADTKIYYVDTSVSNMRNAAIASENVFLFEGIDGSGQERAENSDVIDKNTLQILQRFKPEQFSIVLHSASGGSGAVIGASLVSELMRRGEQVVVIMIGSNGSLKEIDNTLKSLKTYDNLALRHDAAVVVHYLENTPDISRQSIDGAATKALQALLVLFSGENDEMDTADLRTWMRHPKLNNEMVSLHFCVNAQDYMAAGNVITVATLAKTGCATGVTPLPAYQAVGFVEGGESCVLGEDPLHFTISSDLITPTAKALTNKLKEVDARLSSSVRRERLVGRGDAQTDSGLIL